MYESLKRKQEFVNSLSKPVSDYIAQVAGLSYEVFVQPEKGWTQEYLIMHFVGGGYVARTCNCDSKAAILREIARYIDGGYYDEVEDYKHYVEAAEQGKWVRL